MPAKFEITCALAILASAAVADGGAPEVHSIFKDGVWPVVPLDGNVRELADRTVYYLTNDVTIVGGNSTSQADPGESALAVKPGATAYIYIPAGLTLSCTGGCGCAASDGAGRCAPNANVKKATINGVTFNTAEFTVATPGSGGAGASGGGAGIHVPSSSTLAVFGGGTLTAVGGKGGAAGAGGAGGERGLYVAASWCGEEGADINEVENKVYQTNIPNLVPAWSGANNEGWSYGELNAQPTSGGSGGGGAGGGGAAIGTPGSAGRVGYAGGRHPDDELWPKHYNSNPDDCYIACAQGKSGQERTAAADCGTVYLDIAVTNLCGGLGGSSQGGSSGAVTNEYWFSIWSGEFGEEKESEQRLYFVEGGAGGSGGAGGVGMSGVGRGGTGGAGGAGGAAGSVTCKLTTFIKPVNRRNDLTPANGGAGVNGGDGAKSESWRLGKDGYPYNTVECPAGTEVSRYQLSCGNSVTLAMTGADYAGGWSLTKDGAARTLPGLVNDSTAFLTSGPSIYAPGGSVTVGTATCGDVKLGLRNPRVTTSDGGRADIRIRKDSDYYKRYLEPRGTDLAGMEKWLDDPWCEGARNWMGYVLGTGLTNRIALAIGPAANSKMLEICALAVPTNGAKGVWAEIHPPADSWFRPSFRFCTTNDLKAAKSAWPCVCERTGLEGQGVRMEVDPASTDFRQFYRLRVDAVPATEERGD